MAEFHYTSISSKNFDQVVEEIQQKTEQKGFKVQHVHDVQATLASKGFQRSPLKIIEICNAKYAYQVLEKSVFISLMMPCKINVWEQDGQVTISALRPVILKDFFPEQQLEEFAVEVDKILCNIVDEVK